MNEQEFIKQAKLASNNLMKLSRLWEDISGTFQNKVDAASEKNLKYLPSFDEFILDFMDFVDSL